MSFLTTTFSKHHHHLVPLPAHIEDDGALADLVGDDEEGRGRGRVQLLPAVLLL